MKKLICLLYMAVTLMISGVLLTACAGGVSPQTHAHAYGAWSHNESEHWKVCTVESCTKKAEQGAHAYENGVCACGYEEPAPAHVCVPRVTRTYSSTHHWYNCTDPACNERIGEAEHSLSYGMCECGYVRQSAPHTCRFKPTLSFDSEGHWYDCYSSSCRERSQFASHTLVEGACACGFVEPETHECAFASSLTFDDSAHWYACEAENCREKQGEAGHVLLQGVCECGYTASEVYESLYSDDGHSILTAVDILFSENGVELVKESRLRNAEVSFDLRGRFTVSPNASWRAFTSPSCSASTEITTRVASLHEGWNYIYIMVENAMTLEQSVYKLSIYRNRAYEVSAIYNRTETVALFVEEGYPLSGAISSFEALYADYEVDGVYADAALSEPLNGDFSVSESRTVYLDAYYCAVNVDENGVVDGVCEQQPGLVKIRIKPFYGEIEVKQIKQCAEANTVFIDVPATVVKIEEFAFYRARALEGIRLPFVGESAYGSSFQYRAVLGWVFGHTTTSSEETVFQYEEKTLTNQHVANHYYYIPSTLRTVEIYDSEQIPSYAFRGCSKLRTVIISGETSVIGWYAFRGCTLLTTLSLPETVVEVYKGAFDGCESLGVSLYKDCIYVRAGENDHHILIGARSKSLAEFDLHPDVVSVAQGAMEEVETPANTVITIPDGLLFVGGGVFGSFDVSAVRVGTLEKWLDLELGDGFGRSFDLFVGGELLTELVMPEGYDKVPDYAFCNVKSLVTVDLGGVREVGEFAFDGCGDLTVTVNAEQKKLGYASFACNSVTYRAVSLLHWLNMEFDQPYGYGTNIVPAVRLFVGGRELFKLHVPATITKIPDYAFCNVDTIDEANLNAVTEVGTHAFAYCSGLRSLTVPPSVKKIGQRAFADNVQLSAVHVKDLAAWCDIDFTSYIGSSYLLGTNPLSCGAKLYLNGELVTEVVYSESLTAVKALAFENYDYLLKVTLPETVTSIGEYAFYGCGALRQINIPSSVISIGKQAFRDCGKLESVFIPESVEVMGENVFANCHSISLRCQHAEPPRGWHKDWSGGRGCQFGQEE